MFLSSRTLALMLRLVRSWASWIDLDFVPSEVFFTSINRVLQLYAFTFLGSVTLCFCLPVLAHARCEAQQQLEPSGDSVMSPEVA